jgi:uncharacterized protein CbrC (UPF0167 family)
MAQQPLPTFRYHPDPIATGSIEASDKICVACKQARGYVYVGPVYSERELDSLICPWCIADGTAHKLFDAEFTDIASIGDGRNEVSDAIAEEVAYRTPGFSGWQQERWFTHCADAAAYMGAAGHDELAEFGPEAVESIRDEAGLSGTAWERYFNTLDKEGSPTAYVFRCLHCGAYGGYSDCD